MQPQNSFSLGDFLQGQHPRFEDEAGQYVPPELQPQGECVGFGPYYDGIQQRYCDPTRAYRILYLGTDGEFNNHAAHSQSDSLSVRWYAVDKLVGPAREAFGILPFDVQTGIGVTDDDVMDLLAEFTRYLAQKKSKAGTSPDSASATAPGGSGAR